MASSLINNARVPVRVRSFVMQLDGYGMAQISLSTLGLSTVPEYVFVQPAYTANEDLYPVAAYLYDLSVSYGDSILIRFYNAKDNTMAANQNMRFNIIIYSSSF